MFKQFLVLALVAAAAAGIASGAQAQTHIFSTPANATGTSQTTAAAAGRRTVRLDTDALAAMRPGDEALLTTPAGIDLSVVLERKADGFQGAAAWIGHLRDASQFSPVVFSIYEGVVDGTVDGPNLHLRIEGPVGAAVVRDLFAEGLAPLSAKVSDAVRAPRDLLADVEQNLGVTQAQIAVVGNSQIDVLFMYSPNLLTAQGSVAKVIARANTLVNLANTIYSNSGMTVTLNLVAVQLNNAAYADETGTDTSPFNSSTFKEGDALDSLHSDTTVAALRARYGADVVTLVRPFVSQICGLAYVPFDFTAASSAYGFSVVEDGSNGGSFCDNSSMTHEIGHNYGAAHDVGTTVANTPAGTAPDVDGTPAYNRGYCTGSASTIMAYPSTSGCNPLQYKFSSPNLSCPGGACGKAQGVAYYTYSYTDGSGPHTATASGADSVTAINTNAASIATWRAAPKSFVALPAARLLDTRTGINTVDGQYQGAGPLAAGGQTDLSVANRGGMPFQGIGAAVMSVTTINSNANGFLTFWPTGATRPVAGNINPTVGYTVSNLVISKVGSVALASPLSYTDSQVSIYNGATGSTNLAVNILGWLPAGSAYNAITPARFLDTRSGAVTFDGQAQAEGPIAASTSRNLQIGGRDGAPSTGSVVIKITGVQPKSNGFVTAWAAGQAQPGTGNVNLSPGLTMSNLAIVPLGSSGQISLYNGSTTPVDLTADVQGWFPTTSAYTSITPTRLLDTRTSTPIGAQSTLNLTVTNTAGIPTTAGAVVIKATAVTPGSAGFLTIWPKGQTQPSTGNLNMNIGLTISNLVFVQPGTSGQVSIFNGSSTPLNVVVDAQGWFTAP